jgi:CRISPR-associated protein (TIGR03986 family)
LSKNPVKNAVHVKSSVFQSNKIKKDENLVLDVGDEVVEYYFNKVLPYLKDTETGLITSAYPSIDDVLQKKVIDEINAQVMQKPYFKVSQLIYVEVDVGGGDAPRIVSLGHNFYYRWRYRDSIRQTWNNGKPKDRKILSRLEVEKVDSDAADQRPAALSGARLFFGFTADEGNDNKDKVKGLYEQLAGRIAINAALATTEVDKCAKIPLKLAGSPKASAMEFYLQQPRDSKELQDDRQDNGAMRTYGDLLDENEKSGELNGRKFYWHQPDAANIESLYSGDKGENASYGRFLTKPGGEFKFKVRFRALRDWELGLLLFTLAPERFGQAIKNKAEIPNEVNGSRFAHKLGYGKPRGLGSVRVQIDKCILLPDTDEKDFIEQDPDKWNSWVNAAVENLDKDTLNNWLKLVRYPASGRCDYPKDKKDEKDGKVYTYHTEIRKSHAKARRMKQNNPEPDRKLLKRP